MSRPNEGEIVVPLRIHRELYEDAILCAKKVGMNVERFCSEVIESYVAQRRKDNTDRPFSRDTGGLT